MSNVTSKVVSRKGVLKVNPMNAQLYQGNFTGSAVLDASGGQPLLRREGVADRHPGGTVAAGSRG